MGTVSVLDDQQLIERLYAKADQQTGSHILSLLNRERNLALSPRHGQGCLASRANEGYITHLTRVVEMLETGVSPQKVAMALKKQTNPRKPKKKS